MAQQVTIRVVDDTDGTEAAATVKFGIDGHDYEIDLSDDNASKLRDFLAQFTHAGRRITRKRGTTASATPTQPRSRAKVDPEQTRAIREWARQNGHEVSDRGRISASVQEAFDAAH